MKESFPHYFRRNLCLDQKFYYHIMSILGFIFKFKPLNGNKFEYNINISDVLFGKINIYMQIYELLFLKSFPKFTYSDRVRCIRSYLHKMILIIINELLDLNFIKFNSKSCLKECIPSLILSKKNIFYQRDIVYSIMDYL